jgi:CubicO group peptidase (beta-lactamase class C family)
MIRTLFGNRIARFVPEAVTSVNRAAECAPEEAELTVHDVEAIWAAVVALYRTRMHPAIALCVRRRGRVVIDRAIGHARGNAPGDGPDVPKVPVTHETLFNLFSASKALTAMLMHLLVERGLVDLDRPVAAYIPEFARNGKGGITVRHVLTHRAGIPSIRKGNETLDLLADHTRILAILCDARPASRPGHRLAYHAMTGGYLCAEIVRRVTGRGIREFFADEVLRPLGFQHLNFGVAPSDLPRVAEDVFAGPPPPPPIDWLFRRALGVSWNEAPRLEGASSKFYSARVRSMAFAFSRRRRFIAQPPKRLTSRSTQRLASPCVTAPALCSGETA